MGKIVIDVSDLSTLDKDRIASEINSSDEYCLELLYKSDFSTTSNIRNLVSFLCEQLWIDTAWKFKMVLIADELNNNAIEYWSSSWEINKMRIFITKKWVTRDLVIEVEDTWTWKYHKNAEQMVKLKNEKLVKWFTDYSSIRWRWLFLIITNLVDELYFKDSESWWLIVGVKKTI